MMAIFKNAYLSLYDVSLVKRKLEVLYDLYCYFLISCFLFSPENVGERATSYTLQFDELVEQRVFLELCQLLKPLLLNLFTLEVILFLGVKTIAMFENYAKLLTSFVDFNNIQSLHVYDIYWNFCLLMIKNDYSRFDELEIDLVIVFFIDNSGITLDVRSNLKIHRFAIL